MCSREGGHVSRPGRSLSVLGVVISTPGLTNGEVNGGEVGVRASVKAKVCYMNFMFGSLHALHSLAFLKLLIM